LRNYWFLNENNIPYYTSPACCEVVDLLDRKLIHNYFDG